jgi:hypothetical protein
VSKNKVINPLLRSMALYTSLLIRIQIFIFNGNHIQRQLIFWHTHLWSFYKLFYRTVTFWIFTLKEKCFHFKRHMKIYHYEGWSFCNWTKFWSKIIPLQVDNTRRWRHTCITFKKSIPDRKCYIKGLVILHNSVQNMLFSNYYIRIVKQVKKCKIVQHLFWQEDNAVNLSTRTSEKPVNIEVS